MSKKNKKRLFAAIYVLSIVVGVGIGLAQVGTLSDGAGSRTSDCNKDIKADDCTVEGCGVYYKCVTVANGKGADSCNTAAASRCYSTDTPGCDVYSYLKDSAGLTYSECNPE